MTPHFIATLIIAAILYASATLLLLRAYGTTEGAAAPATATQPPATPTRPAARRARCGLAAM